MFARLGLGLLLLAALPLWSQVEPDATGGPVGPDDEYSMSLPTQVSGRAYPMELGSEQRSNYLSGGVIFTTAYDDNVFAGSEPTPLSETSFSLFPVIGISRTTPRTSGSLSYGAGFTFYTPTSSLNSINQNASADFDVRLTRHSSISLENSFEQNSSVYNQPYILSGTSVSGSTIGQSAQIIVPFADQLINSTGLEYGYQFSRDAMVGGGASYDLFKYPDLQDVPGLNNSNSEGAVGFYSRRLSRSQYVGAMYRYTRTTTNPVETTTHTQTVSIFYTAMPSNKLSISLTAGPEYFDTQEAPYPKESSLGSFVMASLDWKQKRTGVAVSYSRAVTAGQGVLGAYTTDSFNLSGRWLIARTWTATLSAAYSNLASAIAVATPSTPGGHTIFGTVSIQHTLSEHLDIAADYRRLHQTYGGIEVISNSPDDDRVSAGIYYRFTRPLGR